LSLRERERLIDRIRQLRRVARPAESARAQVAEPDPPATELEALERRVDELEQLVEGLQDAVYREAERRGKLIAELQEQIQPAAMGAALSRDARERGL
jgi:Flp pilus assembly CpaE family ATPase